MFIFCQNSHSAATYTELLKDFTPVVFTDKASFLSRLNETDFILIDDDSALCLDLLKEEYPQTILFLSKECPPSDDVSFLKKPVAAEMLLNKVSLLLRQIEKGILINFDLQGFSFCGRLRTINNITLTQKEAELVEFLYENKERVVSRDEILQNIFGYKENTQTHTVETHIYKLRQKIGDSQGLLIMTKEGGYCLNTK